MIDDRSITLSEIEGALERLEEQDAHYEQHLEWLRQTGPTTLEAYADNRELLLGAIRDVYAAISAADEDACLGRLHARLNEYRDSAQPFLVWAVEQVKVEARRLEAFHKLQAEYRLYALDGIWSVLRSCSDLDIDERITIAECLAYVGRSIWQHLDSLLAPDQPAKISTRIWTFGYWAARGWKTEQLRRRQKVEHDSDSKPKRVVRPNLDRIEAMPGCPEPDFGAQEIEQAKSDVANANADMVRHFRYRALLCPTCKTLETVNAIEDDRAQLACGHRRSTDWLPAAKAAWESRSA